MTLPVVVPPVDWLSESRESERVVLRIGWDGERLVAEWPNAVRLRAREDGSDVSLELADGLDRALVDKLKSGVVPAFLRHLTGEMSVHCAAVSTASGAVLLVGNSGSGKSTLCAFMCRGGLGELLADDIAHLERDSGGATLVRPSESNHWLLPEAGVALGVTASVGDSKAPTRASRVANAAVPLVAIVFLGWSDAAPSISRIRSAKSVVALSDSLVRFDVRNREVMRRDFERLGDLCTQVPCYELLRCRDFSALAETADLILRTVRENE